MMFHKTMCHCMVKHIVSYKYTNETFKTNRIQFECSRIKKKLKKNYRFNGSGTQEYHWISYMGYEHISTSIWYLLTTFPKIESRQKKINSQMSVIAKSNKFICI